MQTIYLDVSNKGVIPCINAKQNEVGRKFLAIVTDGGIPYNIPLDSVVSVWYEGDSGKGNYTDIGEEPAIEVSGNKISVELIEQMLSVPGKGVITILLNSITGQQIGLWNIDYCVEYVAGVDSEKAEEYYNAFSEAAANLAQAAKMFTVDPTLKNPGQPADAKETGVQISVERKRIDNIIATGSFDDWENNESGQPYFFSDEYVNGFIKTNGVAGYISATVEYLTLSAGEEREIELVGIPMAHKPISDVALISTNTGFYGTISRRIERESEEYKFYFVVRNVTESTLDTELTNFSAFFPTEFVYIAELADARIGPDAEEYPTVGDALRNLTKSVVRYDEDQDLSEEQQKQAAENIGAFRNGDSSITLGEVTAEYMGLTDDGEENEFIVADVMLSIEGGYDGVVLRGICESADPMSVVNKRQLDDKAREMERNIREEFQRADDNVVDRLCPAFETSGRVVNCEDVVVGHPLKAVSYLEESETGYQRVTLHRCGKNLCPVDTVELTGADPDRTLWTGRFPAPVVVQAVLSKLTDKGAEGAAILAYVVDGETRYITRKGEGYAIIRSGVLTSVKLLNWGAAKGTLHINIVPGTALQPIHIPYTGEHYTAAFGKTVHGGSYDWSTGILIDETGEITALTPKRIPGIPGLNTVYSDYGDTKVTGRKDPQTDVIDRLCSSFNKSGTVVICEPVEGYPLAVTAASGAIIHRCGRNFLNLANRTVETAEDWSNATKRSFNGKKVFIGLSVNNYFVSRNIESYTLTETGAEFIVSQSGYCIGFDIPVTPGVTYQVGRTGGVGIQMSFYKRDGSWIETPDGTLKAPEGAAWAVVLLLPRETGTTAKYTKVYVGAGTETGYEPYRGELFTHIPGIKIPAMSGENVLYATSGSITVKGRNDPNVMHNDFQTRIAALEAAIANNT